MKKLVKNKLFAYFISMFCMFLWGSAFPTIKLTYKALHIGSGDFYSMILVAGMRFFLAGILVLLLMSVYDRKSIIQLKTNFSKLFILSLIVISFGYLFFYIGTGNTSGMKSALITSSSTFLVVIFSHFQLHDENFNIYKLIAIIMGLLGVVITNIDKEFNLTFNFFGEGFMIINSLLTAYGTIYVKKHLRGVSPFAIAAGQFLYGSIMLIIVGYFGNKLPLVFTAKAMALIFYGGIISSCAFSLWYFILNEYKASEVAFLRLFIPFFGTFLSALVLGESLNLSILIGLVFVIFGIIIVNKSNNMKKVKG